MARRQTARVQRRPRASDRARNARLDERGGGLPLPLPLLALGGFLALGAVGLVVFALVGGGNTPIGQEVRSAGGVHIDDGTPPPAGSYTSVPATSGPHWETPAQWGVYPTALPEAQVVHNLEHGGIVIWYDRDRVGDAVVEDLTSFVRGQVSGSRYKFILSPWDGDDFGHGVAVTAWTRLLYLDCPAASTTAAGSPGTPPATCAIDVGRIGEFADRYYQRVGPEPGGGPGPPA